MEKKKDLLDRDILALIMEGKAKWEVLELVKQRFGVSFNFNRWKRINKQGNDLKMKIFNLSVYVEFLDALVGKLIQSNDKKLSKEVMTMIMNNKQLIEQIDTFKEWKSEIQTLLEKRLILREKEGKNNE